MSRNSASLTKRVSGSAYRAFKYIDAMIPGRPIPADRPGNVVMFHAGRSGSTVLGHMLGDNREIFWDHEVFNPNHGLWREQTEPAVFLRRRMGRAGRRFYGFELQLHGPETFGRDWPGLIELLAAAGISHFIVLQRRNVLRSIVSRTAVHFGGHRHHRRHMCAPRRRVTIDVDEARFSEGRLPLVAGLAQVEAEFAALRSALAGSAALSLVYENDIADDPRIAYDKTCRYLGLSALPVAVKYARANPYPLRETIENFAEVKSVLAGTSYGWMLNE
ncbi:MAG: hypothetical protein GY791_17640 [Alphaproteobacteria bacterium]|nr:hypothetical protein [Alphaproteobacteria bacterium]